jgi:hypothetical protein
MDEVKMYSEFEEDLFTVINLWAYDFYRDVSPDDVPTKKLVADFWDNYINTCQMSESKDGMELAE